jgi:hypothetical protein
VNVETQLKISRNQLVRIEKRIRQREARLDILNKDRLAVVKRIEQLESYRVSRKKEKSERITTDILDK